MSYTHLVLSGGGIKGIAMIAALQTIEEKSNGNFIKNLNAFIGSSVGGLICFFLSIGFTLNELYQIMINIDFSQFQKIKFSDFFTNWGIDSGESFMKLITVIAYQKNIDIDITFQELFQNTNKYLILTGSEITKNEIKFFSHIDTPNFIVKDAIRITISYPGYYFPIKIKDEIFEDGALYNPYPINYFKDVDKKKIIGIILHRRHNIPKIDDFEKFLLANFQNLVERYEKFYIHGYENNTIIIDIPNYNAMQYSLSLEQKIDIYNQGKDVTQKFITQNKLFS